MDYFIYIGIFSISWIVITGVLYTPMLIKMDYISDEWFAIGTLVICFVSSPSSFILLGEAWDYYPPIQQYRVGADELESNLLHIDEKAKNLRKALENVDELTLIQIQELLSGTLDFASELEATTRNQTKLITELKVSVEAEKSKAKEAKEIAENVISITKPQLEGIKLLITQDAAEQSRKSFYLGLIVSFPLGILASLMAAWIHRSFSRRDKRKTEGEN